jgi:hypothetical protein
MFLLYSGFVTPPECVPFIFTSPHPFTYLWLQCDSGVGHVTRSSPVTASPNILQALSTQCLVPTMLCCKCSVTDANNVSVFA